MFEWRQEEQDSQEALQLAKEAQEKEFEILRALMEDTTDQEIEELRAKCALSAASDLIKLEGLALLVSLVLTACHAPSVSTARAHR